MQYKTVKRIKRQIRRTIPLFAIFLLLPLSAAVLSAGDLKVPRTWDEDALADWAMPLVGFNGGPGHFSEREYYAAPIENLKTYPVYDPDREPAGYWADLQKKKPESLLDVNVKRTHAQWVSDGNRVFEELDLPASRIWDPAFIARARSKDELAKYRFAVNEDGTIFGIRWVVTPKGVALGMSECAFCHTHYMPSGQKVYGPASNRLLRGSPP